MNLTRLVLAALAVWITGLLLVTIGELTDAIPSTLLTKLGPRDLFQEAEAGAFADLVPRERMPNWPRLVFLTLAPVILSLVANLVLRWTPGSRIPDAKTGSTSLSLRFSKTTAKIVVAVLRVARGVSYSLVAWQLVTLLPSLAWLAAPDQVTGKMLAQLLLKVLLLAAFSLVTWMLRKVIDWLHIVHFGCPHPAFLARSFAL